MPRHLVTASADLVCSQPAYDTRAHPSAESPILFLVFNRPDTTARVFDAIRAARPRRLFVAADGPRADRADEVERCRQVREIATAVDWPCETRTLFRQDNLGCKRAVSSAIDWFFDQVEEGLVLEDDCVPDPTFFGMCDELLTRYRDDQRVMCITGDNFIAQEWKGDSSYYFSRYAHVWGWASWRRAWSHYRVDLDNLDRAAIMAILRNTAEFRGSVAQHWADVLCRVRDGSIDTWDYQWAFAIWRHAGLVCTPRSNLVSNIGFGPGATHTTDPDARHAKLAVEPLIFPLVHPSEVREVLDADRWIEDRVYEIHERTALRSWLGRQKLALRRTWGRMA
jgi:hypothetical protein